MVASYPHGIHPIIGTDTIDDMKITTAYTRHNYLTEGIYLGILELLFEILASCLKTNLRSLVGRTASR